MMDETRDARDTIDAMDVDNEKRNLPSRTAQVHRQTAETEISVSLNLDGNGIFSGNEQIPFLEHLLQQMAKHSLIDVKLHIQGDLAIDDHHSTEDSAIVLGQALDRALGKQRIGIFRYGYATLPMDDALVTVSIDLGGRPYFRLMQDQRTGSEKARDFLHSGTMIGSFNPELTGEFLEKLAFHARMNLYVLIHSGGNLHHLHELVFKALGKSLRMALQIDPRQAGQIPSTKGLI